MDSEQLGQAAIGAGIVIAAVYNGYQSVTAKRHAKHAADLARANAAKVTETHKQVTVNGHRSSTPTLLDRVDTLATQAEEARIAALAVGRMLEGHLDRSAGEWNRLWQAIHHLQNHDDPHERPPRE